MTAKRRTDAQRARAAELARARRARLKAEGTSDEVHRDKTRRAEWSAEWRAKNRDKIAASKRAAYRKNPWPQILKGARKRAEAAGMEFDLTVDDLEIPTHCPYLLVRMEIGDGQGPAFNSPTLDRIDNARGYVPGNVRVISHAANRMKSNLTEEQLLVFADSVIRIHRTPLDPKDID